jgi:hypothetical protein
MRTFTYSASCFTVLLVLCLMFAPSRRVVGDRMASASPHEEVLPDLHVTTTKDFATLCKSNPLEAITESMRAYKKLNAEGYTCTFVKQERLGGKLHPQETINCAFREVPFSVLMRWQDGKRRAEATLYVAGENDERLLIIPATDIEKRIVRNVRGTPYALRALDSSDAKNAARYPANQFGLFKLTTQVYTAWNTASEQNALQVVYRGVESVPQLDGRKCHVLERTCREVEEDAITKVVVYFDVESKLQLGTILYAGDEMLALYFYKNVQFNPEFGVSHFKAENFQ